MDFRLFIDGCFSVRRFGFHGISYSYLAKEAARLLGRPPFGVSLLLRHLGAAVSLII